MDLVVFRKSGSMRVACFGGVCGFRNFRIETFSWAFVKFRSLIANNLALQYRRMIVRSLLQCWFPFRKLRLVKNTCWICQETLKSYYLSHLEEIASLREIIGKSQETYSNNYGDCWAIYIIILFKYKFKSFLELICFRLV